MRLCYVLRGEEVGSEDDGGEKISDSIAGRKQAVRPISLGMR